MRPVCGDLVAAHRGVHYFKRVGVLSGAVGLACEHRGVVGHYAVEQTHPHEEEDCKGSSGDPTSNARFNLRTVQFHGRFVRRHIRRPTWSMHACLTLPTLISVYAHKSKNVSKYPLPEIF